MGFWNRVRDLVGLGAKDFAVEGDRVVFRSLSRAREVALEPPTGPEELEKCEGCSRALRRVVFTTAGTDQVQLWSEYPLAVDGWVCTSCGWSAMPRRLTADEVVEFEKTGIEHAQAGQLDDAEYWFRRVAASWNGYPTALANLGMLYKTRAEAADDAAVRKQHRAVAEGFFRRAITDDKFGVPGAIIELARLEAIDGRETEAIGRLERAPDPVRDAARELLEQIRDGNALFTRASELSRRHLIIAGHALSQLDAAARRDLIDAKELLREANARKPSFPAYWVLGKIEQRLGRGDAALDALEKAVACNPDQPDGLREYVLACLSAGRHEQAVEPARRATRVAPNDVGLRSNLALVLLLAGKVDEALEIVEAALSEDPKDAITAALAARIREIRSGKRPRPKSLADLERG